MADACWKRLGPDHGLFHGLPHERSEGGHKTMTFVEFQPPARSAPKRPAKVVRRAPVGLEGVEMRGVEVACVETELSRREGRLHFAGQRIKGSKRGCAHCAHPGLRIELYRRHTRSDWGGFRGSGGFSRVGARFESHLGHSIFPFKGYFAFECGHFVLCGPLRWPFFYWLRAPWPGASFHAWCDCLSFDTSSWAFMDRRT